MDVFYDSDWHIHSEASYDADLKVPDLIQSAKINGIKQFGITDHVNYPFMVKHLERSRDLFLANQTEGFHLGVELNTDFFVSDRYTDYFKRQYAEYLCMLHEKGVPISIGSDLHGNYTAHHEQIRHYMEPLGFTKDNFAVPRLRKYQN